MDKRELKVLISKAGGNASAEAKSYKISIPSAWIKKIGITQEDRICEVSFDETKKEIIIKKKY